MTGDPELDLDGFDEEEDLATSDIVLFADDNGEEHPFLLLAELELDNIDYALLSPLQQIDDDDDEHFDVFIFRVTVDANGAEYEVVDSEEEFARVREAAAALMKSDGLEHPIQMAPPKK